MKIEGLILAGGGAYLMKKEAAAEVGGEEEQEVEVEVLAMGTGSPAWQEPFSLQGMTTLPLVMGLTGGSKAATCLSASPMKPWAC